MHWVLIWWFSFGSEGIATASAQFSDQAACLAALEALGRETVRGTWLRGVCVPEATK